MENSLEPYKKSYSEKKFWSKLRRYAKVAGIKAVYSALLMFYAFRRKETPYWAKSIIVGVLGYFLAPIDALPDLTPLIGYTDDLGMLGLGLVTIAAYINPDVRQQAREKLHQWFGNYDEKELQSIDEKL